MVRQVCATTHQYQRRAGDERCETVLVQQFFCSGCRLELDGSTIGQERKIQPTILDDIGTNIRPLAHQLIVQRTRGGTAARVNASAPNSRLPGLEDFQLPRPRLQSKQHVEHVLRAEADGVTRALDGRARHAIARG